MRKALRDGGWRYPAIFALVVQVVGGVNATALLFAGRRPGAVDRLRVAGRTRGARGGGRSASTAKTGVLTLAHVAVVDRRARDARRLRPRHPEVHRDGRGGRAHVVAQRDPARARLLVLLRPGPARAVDRGRRSNYTQRAGRHRRRLRARRASRCSPPGSCAGGTASSSSACSSSASSSPSARIRTTSPTPLGAVFKAFATSSTAGLALRSTGARRPARRARDRGAARASGRTRCTPRCGAARGRVLAVAVSALVVVLLARQLARALRRHVLRQEPPATRGHPAVLEATRRPRSIAGGNDTRVLELPGADFASYRWGNTVDPITPGLMDRPYVARELIPYGTRRHADLAQRARPPVPGGRRSIPAGSPPLAAAHGRRRRRAAQRHPVRALRPRDAARSRPRLRARSRARRRRPGSGRPCRTCRARPHAGRAHACGAGQRAAADAGRGLPGRRPDADRAVGVDAATR